MQQRVSLCHLYLSIFNCWYISVVLLVLDCLNCYYLFLFSVSSIPCPLSAPAVRSLLLSYATSILLSVSFVLMVLLGFVLPSLSSLASCSCIIHSLTSVFALARSSVAVLRTPSLLLSLCRSTDRLSLAYLRPFRPDKPLSRSLAVRVVLSSVRRVPSLRLACRLKVFGLTASPWACWPKRLGWTAAVVVGFPELLYECVCLQDK